MPKCKCCGETVTSGVILHSDCYEELREASQALRHAKNDGFLLELPCKVGDMMWFIACKTVMFGRCRNISIHSGGMQISLDDKSGEPWCVSYKNVFKTREDAVAALKGARDA